MDQTLDEAIYNRYIAPTKRQRTGRVGLEFELPVVNREHAPVDFEVIHKVMDAISLLMGDMDRRCYSITTLTSVCFPVQARSNWM